ncbi:MAG: enoyl-ACP reductase [Gammaproteobacteria bacterium]|jgi:enoyl-[acyl-carrier protein] reductase I|nr:enoyl-ACP reductase [Gammaproteobacteria bacterium]
MGFLEGKRALIVGLASNRSIAWGVAQAMHREGATLAFTYQNDKLKERVEGLAPQAGSTLCLSCDVASDEEVQAVFDRLGQEWGTLDILVHSVAYAPREQLEGNFLDTVTRDGFRIAQDISAYSLAALAKGARPLMHGRGGSIVTMSYLGAVRAVPHYNVMGIAKASLEATVRYLADNLGPEGIRVNAVSAGPIRTLAAAGISDFRRLLDYSERNTPLRRNVTIEEVGNVAAFLCSDLASGMTGDVVYVDGGFHVTAMGSGPL